MNVRNGRKGEGYFLFFGPTAEQQNYVAYARWSRDDKVTFDTICLSELGDILSEYEKYRGKNLWPLFVRARVLKIRYKEPVDGLKYYVKLQLLSPDMTCKLMNTMFRHNLTSLKGMPSSLGFLKSYEGL